MSQHAGNDLVLTDRELERLQNFLSPNQQQGSQDPLQVATDEMVDLGEKARSSYHLFRTVSQHLMEMRASLGALSETEANTARGQIDLFEQAWEVQYQSFNNLLFNSQVIAGTAATAIEQFIFDILPFIRNATYSLEDKRKAIEEFIGGMPEWEKEARDLATGFIELQNQVSRFADILNSFVHSHLSANPQLQKLMMKHWKLQRALSSVNQKILEACDNSSKDSILDSLKLLAKLCPSLWKLLVVQNFLGLVDDQKSLEDKKLRLVETIKSKGNEIRNKHKWGPILLSCSDGESIVKELLTRLGLFCIVWAAIRADLQHARQYLERQQIVASGSLFDHYTNTCAALYKVLRHSLREYERLVPAVSKNA